MWFPFAILGSLLGLAVSKMSKAKTAPAIPIRPSTNSWRIWCMPLSVATGIPIEFALAWIQKESGGNPCAWGSANAKDPTGHPREQGIGQLYSPDDMKRFGIAPGALRVYCVPGTQKCSRELTKEEKAAQAKALYQLMGWHRKKAVEAMQKTGTKWSGSDYWRMVKLDHALPGLVRQGLPRVTAYLGAPPKTWSAFKSAILGGKVKLDTGTERYRKHFARLLNNAESTGASVKDGAKGVA